MRRIISSESVFDGHPDKVCDQISDAILDEILLEDKKARVVVECAIKNTTVNIIGEITTTAIVDYKYIARKTLLDIGYLDEYEVFINISEQSPDIAQGVDERSNHLQGAVDQGIMYGYATNETVERIPAPLALAYAIAKRYKELRKTTYYHLFAPDGKCQVSYVYEDDVPFEISTIIISAQTKLYIDPSELKRIITKDILEPLVGDVSGMNILVNLTGEILIGGPESYSGLTDRKIIVDTYGGFSHDGGGAFSGKDVSKVDRSAAYYARYAAKAFVEAGLASRCEVGVAYAIGVSQPVSLYIDTFNTGIISDDDLSYFLKVYFDFAPASIRKELELDSVKYKDLACFDHVGRNDLNVRWEHVESKAKELWEAYGKAKSLT